MNRWVFVAACRWYVSVILVVLSASVVLWGCTGIDGKESSVRYGKIRPDNDVRRAFESYVVKPDHTYYISGVESHPNAIIAIDNRYTLESKLWKKRVFVHDDEPSPFVKVKETSLKYYVNGMKVKVAQFNILLTGFHIYDNEGNDIGDWYSILEAPRSIRILEDNRMSIVPPPSNLYDKYDENGPGKQPWMMP